MKPHNEPWLVHPGFGKCQSKPHRIHVDRMLAKYMRLQQSSNILRSIQCTMIHQPACIATANAILPSTLKWWTSGLLKSVDHGTRSSNEVHSITVAELYACHLKTPHYSVAFFSRFQWNACSLRKFSYFSFWLATYVCDVRLKLWTYFPELSISKLTNYALRYIPLWSVKRNTNA